MYQPQNACREQQNYAGDGAEQVQVMSGAVRQAPSHAWEQMQQLSDMGECGHDKATETGQ